MTPLGKCLETLRVLINKGDAQGIVVAEKAIDEFIAREPSLDRRMAALNALDVALVSLSQNKSGSSYEFAKTVSAYIDRRVRELDV